MPHVLNHLWQSTLFAAAAGLLALWLRHAPARVRYAIWLTASVKFLIPFSVVMAVGRAIAWRPPAASSPAIAVVADVLSDPFRGQWAAVQRAASANASPDAWPWHAIQTALIAIWIGGTALMLWRAIASWLALRRLVQSSEPVTAGREAELLNAVAGAGDRPRLLLVDAAIEPGVFGVRRPVILWPRHMSSRLSDPQIVAILRHEIAHVRRRDNQTALLHLAARASFWFHPLLAWIDARLMAERERACDEEVTAAGSTPRTYAEGLLKTCEFFLESCPAFVASAAGADLTQRVASIMRANRPARVSAVQSGAVAVLAASVVVGPFVAGLLASPPRALGARAGGSADAFGAAAPAAGQAPSPQFEVASVKRNEGGDMRVMLGFQPGGRFTATNVTLQLLIADAYRVQSFQLVNVPDWISSERFDITAKAEDLPPGEMQRAFPAMLQGLLADRFGLVVHRETREMPLFALTLARGDGRLGPKLTPSALDCEAMRQANERGAAAPPSPGAPGRGGSLQCGMRIGPGTLSSDGLPVTQLAPALSRMTNRVVVDKTGLSGPYKIELSWTPDAGGGPLGSAGPAVAAPDGAGASIFTALQEQLGLKLESQRGPVDVIVIDKVSRPTPD